MGLALTPRSAGGGPVLVEFVCKLGILKMPPAREIASGKENNRGARTAYRNYPGSNRVGSGS